MSAMTLLRGEARRMGQAIAPQSIFANFANRFAVNADQHLHATETRMKLAVMGAQPKPCNPGNTGNNQESPCCLRPTSQRDYRPVVDQK